MQVWKRRAVVLLAVGAGTAGLMMSSAGAQTPPTTIPTFTLPTFPDFPDFPTIPTFTIPPPTMPPPTSSTTSPPPTMPPPTATTTTPPPTMPPITIPPITLPPDTEAQIEDVIQRLEEFGETFAELIEELQGILDAF